MATGKPTFKAPDYSLHLKRSHAAPTRGRLGVSAVRGDMEDIIVQYLALNKVLGATGVKPLQSTDIEKINSLLDKMRSDNPITDQEQQFLHAAIDNIERTYANLANTNKDFVVDLSSIIQSLEDELKDDRLAFETKLKVISQAQGLLSQSSNDAAKALRDTIDVSKVRPTDIGPITDLLSQVIPKIKDQKVPVPTPDAEKIERINRYYDAQRSQEGGGGGRKKEDDGGITQDIEELYGIKDKHRNGVSVRLQNIYERKRPSSYGIGELLGEQKYTEALGEHIGYVGATFRDTFVRGLLTATAAPLVPIAEALKLPELMEISYQHLKKGISNVIRGKKGRVEAAATPAEFGGGAGKSLSVTPDRIFGPRKSRVESRDDKHQTKLLKYVEEIHHGLLRYLKKLDQPVLKSHLTSFASTAVAGGGLFGGALTGVKGWLETLLPVWIYEKLFGKKKVPIPVPTPGGKVPTTTPPVPKGGKFGKLAKGAAGAIAGGLTWLGAAEFGENTAKDLGVSKGMSSLIGQGVGLGAYYLLPKQYALILTGLALAIQQISRKPQNDIYKGRLDPKRGWSQEEAQTYRDMEQKMYGKIKEGIFKVGDIANSTWDIIIAKAKDWTLHAGDAANRMWEMLKNGLGDAWDWAAEKVRPLSNLPQNAARNLRHPPVPDQVPQPGTPEYQKHVRGTPRGMPGKRTKELPTDVNDALITAFGGDAGLMKNVMIAESSGMTSAFNVNKNGSADYGLFQINNVHIPELVKAGIIDREDDLFIPEKNIAAAKFLYDRKIRKGGVGTEDWYSSQKRWSKMAISPMTFSSYAQNTENVSNANVSQDDSSFFANSQYNNAAPTSQLAMSPTSMSVEPMPLVKNSQAASEAVTKSNKQQPIVVPQQSGGNGGGQAAPPSSAAMPAYAKVDDPYLSMLNIFANY